MVLAAIVGLLLVGLVMGTFFWSRHRQPTWKMTSDYPLIAGRWKEWDGIFLTIRQYGSHVVADCEYQQPEVVVRWHADGKITRDGQVSMNLVHTHPHSPDKWLPQTRTAVLNPDGKALEGYAVFEGGGHKFTWKLVEPREVEQKELSR